jgi:hypothetical protein
MLRGRGLNRLSRVQYRLEQTVLIPSPVQSEQRKACNPRYSFRVVGLFVPMRGVGLLVVPGPTPIVSPVVPLSSTPLFTPAPVVWRSFEPDTPFVEVPAGEIADWPEVLPAPLLCAIDRGAFKTQANIVANAMSFMSDPKRLYPVRKTYRAPGGSTAPQGLDNLP